MSKPVFWKDVLFPGDIADLRSVGGEGVIVPSGSTAFRPASPVRGTIRDNSSLGYVEMYTGTAWEQITTSGVTGEINTGVNIGAGQGVFASKSGLNLQFKSLVAGTGVSIGSSSTELVINATGIGEFNDGVNIGSGTGLIYDSKLGTDIQLRSLISLSPSLTITTNGSNIEFDFTPTVGEINDGQNTGGFNEVFRDKVGLDLRFRTINTTANQIDITQNADNLLFAISDDVILPGTGAVTIPNGVTLDEPAPVNGMIRYDTTTDLFRVVIAGAWQTVPTTVGSFLPLTGGTMTGDITLGAGINLVGSVGSEIILQDTIRLQAGANVDMTTGGSIYLQAGQQVDGRDLSEDGGVIDEINPLGDFGFVARVGDPRNFGLRTITGNSNQIDVVDGDGVAGDPIINIAPNPIIDGTEAISIPAGTTAQRSTTPIDGALRVNIDTNNLEYNLGGDWYVPVATVGGVVNFGFDMGGFDISNIGLTDGRDLTADGVIIDEINAITTDTGVMVKSGGSVITRLISASTLANADGLIVANGDGSGPISVGLDIVGMTSTTALTSADEFAVYDIATSSNVKATVADIITLISSTGLSAELDPTGEFGFVTRIADGSPGDFERRTITVDSTISGRGLTIVNGDGIAGDPLISLDYASLPTIPSISSGDLIQIHEAATGTNYSTTILQLRKNLTKGNMRVSSQAPAIPIGVNIVPFTINALDDDFDLDGFWSDAIDTYIPSGGYYRFHLNVMADATTTAGRYVFRFRKNGTPLGNYGILVADGTNLSMMTFDDVFLADGTDEFTVEVDNSTGGPTMFNYARLLVTRDR